MKQNLVNILISFLLFVSIVLLIYTFYKSEIVFDSKRINHYLIYYIISSLGILFFTILFFLNKNFKENILISLITFTILFYIIEIALIFIFKKNMNEIEVNQKRRIDRAKIILDKYNIEVDTRSKLEFQKDQKKLGNEVSLLLTPYRMIQSEGIKNYSFNDESDQLERLYPLSGLSKILTVGGSETGEFLVYKSDRYGFHNPDKEWDNEVKIVVIGDSNVHSSSSKWEKGWAGNIKRLTNKSTLGLGIGNNGPLLELATLKEYAEELKPEIVLWVYCEDNDLMELVEEVKSKILLKYLNKNFTQNLMNKQKLIEKNYKIFVNNQIKERKIINHNEAFSYDKNTQNNFLTFIKLTEIRNLLFGKLINYLKETNPEKNLNNFENVISKAKKITDEFGGEFYFIYLPATTRYINSYNSRLKKNDYYREEVLEIINNLNIDMIDLWDLYFKDLDDPLSSLYFRMHSHYNEDTVKILTKKIVQIIEK